MATIQETIKSWPHFGWGGWYADTDVFSADPATSHITEVEVRPDQKRIKITVQKADNGCASALIPLDQIIPPEKAVFEKVGNALKSAIGKTLIKVGEISI